jgi:cytoskeletal protein RodZ
MDASSFGARLRQQRESRGVSLEAISSATRISVRSLEAIENNQWDRLPGGVFNRGFIRSIGRFLGLDEKALLAEYMAATNDLPQPRLLPDEPRSIWPMILWAAAATILVVALAAGGWAIYHHFRARAAIHVSAPAQPAAIARPVASRAASLPAPASNR